VFLHAIAHMFSRAHLDVCTRIFLRTLLFMSWQRKTIWYLHMQSLRNHMVSQKNGYCGRNGGGKSNVIRLLPRAGFL